MSNNYLDFLNTKTIVSQPTGKDISDNDINPILYDFQRAVVRWAIRIGRAAIFEDCGLGKTIQQIEWARIVGGRVLVVAPLSVAEQTITEASEKLNLSIPYVTTPADINSKNIVITNYERIRSFIEHADMFKGIVLDESSILKSIDGKTRRILIDGFKGVPWKLCCTATPCPNDIAELANHSAFLEVMTREQMLAAFFVHDQDGWRIRGHAYQPFYKWMATWAMAIKRPDDLNFDGTNFELPALNIHDRVVATNWRRSGELFPGAMKGITDRALVRRTSISDRVKHAAKIANETDSQVIVWCGLNDESDMVTQLIPDAVQIAGSDDPGTKHARIIGFKQGQYRVLVTKPKIAGFGLNFQNANKMIFVGLSDSYESYYQCIRRSWRFGQKQPVDVYVVVTDHETEIVNNVRRKELQAEAMSSSIISAARKYEMEELGKMQKTNNKTINCETYTGKGWEIRLGDCVEEIQKLDERSIDFSVFSPPFLSLYQYSETSRDMGNSASRTSFFKHFQYLINGLLHAVKPGRIVAVHCAQVPTTLVNEGVIGMTDFRGDMIREFVSSGFIYHGEVCIDKCPQAQAIRTKAKGLMFAQLRKDSSWSRPGLADYILAFRKPGENTVPIHPDITNDQWIEWARPIWYGIRESNTLNKAEARDDKDDKHICPLQLETVERCIRLWSNPGELVLSPFAGIGSEIYQAVKLGRRGIGFELKELYAKTAAKNCSRAEFEKKRPEMFNDSY
tara:strand:- start:7854 stop:10061 length:2208 start_codon:yes stop_codon:yes gene_type:complete